MSIIDLWGESLISEAKYSAECPAAFQGNPFIEALPFFDSTKQIIEALCHTPKYRESDRALPLNVRLTLLPMLKTLFVPMSRDIDNFNRVYSEMINSYARRRVSDPGYFANVTRQQDDRLPQVVTGRPGRYAGCILPIVGLSGAGKTTAVERWLNIIPQAIRHSSYKGRSFQTTQVPWVRISCPSDASPKSFCKSFYRYLDSILETNYTDRFAKSMRSGSDLRASVVRLSVLHGLALLVVDDLENMSKVKSGGEGQLLNFIYNLSEELGAPILLISTYEAFATINNSFRSLRRGVELGWTEWESLSGSGWNKYFKTLWEIQFTKDITPYSKEMSDVFLYETGGIPGLAWILYKLSQERAIRIGEQGDHSCEGAERITCDLVRSVAKDNFVLLKEALESLRSGVSKGNIRFPDLLSPVITKKSGRSAKGSYKKNIKSTVSVEKKAPNKRKKQESKKAKQLDSKKAESSYETLQRAGLILDLKNIEEG
ncbi:MAG: AAA family ATPase [Cycloclasticus sp.]|nr:AAA family ATPase [Cycloclasticus sp.]